MVNGFDRIKKGMTKEQVASLLGDPVETRQLRFGNELLTTWVYQADGKTSYVWFDESDTVKITSVE